MQHSIFVGHCRVNARALVKPSNLPLQRHTLVEHAYTHTYGKTVSQDGPERGEGEGHSVEHPQPFDARTNDRHCAMGAPKLHATPDLFRSN